MVRIRLMRVGKRKQPSYRVVVADQRSPRDGRIIEALGHYAPRREPSEISIDTDRAVYWLQQGAQPSNQVRKLLQLSGAWTAFTGEAGPEMQQPAAKAAKATPAASVKAASVKATPAASVDDDPAEVPEATDQQAAAPDAEPQEDK